MKVRASTVGCGVYRDTGSIAIETNRSWLPSTKPKNYTYTFTLPNFQQGVSELHYGLAATGGNLKGYDFSHILQGATAKALQTPSGFRLEQGACLHHRSPCANTQRRHVVLVLRAGA